jgi:hypothetical protein
MYSFTFDSTYERVATNILHLKLHITYFIQCSNKGETIGLGFSLDFSKSIEGSHAFFDWMLDIFPKIPKKN